LLPRDDRKSDLTISSALHDAFAALEKEEGAASLPDDAAFLLAVAAAGAIHSSALDQETALPFANGDWSELSDAAYRWLRSRKHELNAVCSEIFPGQANKLESLFEVHARRIAMLSADRLTARSIAPPLRIQDSHQQLTLPLAAVVFQTWPHFADEIAPVLVDASASRGTTVAVHTSWVSEDGQIARAVCLDAHNDRLVEADLRTPLAPEWVLLLLGPRGAERSWHAEWASRFERGGSRVMNSQSFAEIADDKWETYEIWKAAGIPTPDTCVIQAAVLEADRLIAVQSATNGFEKGGGFVCKPRHGTEGCSVIVCQSEGMLEAVDRVIASGDDCIVQRFENDLVWLDVHGVPHIAVLRINVARDRRGVLQAESGWLHVAAGKNRVASVGQSGSIQHIVAGSMRVLRSGTLVGIRSEEMFGVEEIACSAVKTIDPSGVTALAGVDIVLRVGDDGKVAPLALEVNPRPAGLSHSRFIVPNWQSAGPPGVSERMWHH
jgi:hypothetical protein